MEATLSLTPARAACYYSDVESILRYFYTASSKHLLQTLRSGSLKWAVISKIVFSCVFMSFIKLVQTWL